MRERDIFIQALEKDDPDERADVLDKACQGDVILRGQVERLLAEHERQESFILDAPPAGLDATVDRTVVEQPGVFIAGRYKLLEEIGEGGMGTVWVAEQTAPVRRKVALKLIKSGMDSKSVLARFEAERQALAVMDHPNIAKVLDGGLTDSGRPYFVMEYVKGVPITEYCDAARLRVRERLQLFSQVCQAVQHAHQKGIIHRDLKPSNILVAPYDDKPVPKVIDFGLAKAIHQSLTEKTLHTAHDVVLGTPLYMSPEQAQLNNIDVDTRSDIYSLGVLLYELLTGSTPLEKQRFKEAAWDEVRRIIREEEPPRPSLRLSSARTLPSLAAGRHTEPARLTKLVRGELDWIVMKALEKDRTRRYETANGLAADVLRYLAGEPVLAAPPSALYRASKFVRRYKGKVIAASLLLLTLVAGVVGTTLGLIEARRQQRIAVAEVLQTEKARRKTREALDTLTSDALEGWFTREQVLNPEQTDVLHRLLDQYAEFAEEGGDAADDRKGQVRALVRVGRIQRALGDRPAAGVALRRAAELA
ncbi:MAG TPA: serine/threonine-protein kinase, partial [Pirellulaceae bacterium]